MKRTNELIIFSHFIYLYISFFFSVEDIKRASKTFSLQKTLSETLFTSVPRLYPTMGVYRLPVVRKRARDPKGPHAISVRLGSRDSSFHYPFRAHTVPGYRCRVRPRAKHSGFGFIVCETPNRGNVVCVRFLLPVGVVVYGALHGVPALVSRKNNKTRPTRDEPAKRCNCRCPQSMR